MQQDPKTKKSNKPPQQQEISLKKSQKKDSVTLSPRNQNPTKPDSSLPKIKNTKQLRRNIKNLLTQEVYTRANSSVNRPKSIGDRNTNFLQRYEWLYKQTQYTNLGEEQIRQQNKKLRDALYRINDQVDDMLRRMNPKMQKNMNKLSFYNKSRMKTDGVQFLSQNNNNSEHRKQIQNKQSSNNEFMLKMYRKQYNKLKRRQKFITGYEQQASINENLSKQSNTASMVLGNSRRRQKLQTNIDETFEQIIKLRKLNKEIQLKNKQLGTSIHETDDFILDMRRTQNYVQLELKNKLRLQKKLLQSQKSLTQIYKKLNQIRTQYQNAEQYLLKNNKGLKNIQSNKQKQQTLKKKQQIKHLLQKKIQLETQNKQINYHNLLKTLQTIVENVKKTDSKIEQIQANNIQHKNQVSRLQDKLQRIKLLNKEKINKSKIGLMLLSNELITDQDKTIQIVNDKQQKNKRVYYKSPALNSSASMTQKQRNKTIQRSQAHGHLSSKDNINNNESKYEIQIQTELSKDHLNINEYNQQNQVQAVNQLGNRTKSNRQNQKAKDKDKQQQEEQLSQT